MQIFPPTVILRHRRENLKKCSLRGLESRKDFLFVPYPGDSLPDLTGYIQFALDAPPITNKDLNYGFFFIDATWRLADPMERFVAREMPGLVKRSLPAHYRTAYPRKQTGCMDAERGLATVEAVYLAYLLSGRNTTGLLDNYYWKNEFLSHVSKIDFYPEND